MYWAALKISISVFTIVFCSWLSGKKPELAGFIIALPISTMLVLAFSFAEFKDPENTARFARSILAAIPLSLTFFIPFLLAHKINMPFWALYAGGLGFLTIAYFVHTFIMKSV